MACNRCMKQWYNKGITDTVTDPGAIGSTVRRKIWSKTLGVNKCENKNTITAVISSRVFLWSTDLEV